MTKFTQVEKLTDCEYEDIDKSSEPCSNPPVFIDRLGGHVVCIMHAEALELFLQHRHNCHMEELDAQVKLAHEADASQLKLFPKDVQ